MIENLLINSLLIYGIHASTRTGQLLNFLTKFVVIGKGFPTPKQAHRQRMLEKVTYDCPPCMASLYGTAYFLLLVDMPFYYLPVWVLSLSGLNYILNKL